MDPVLHAFHDELEKTAGSVSALVDRARKATSGGSFAGAHASGEADKGGSFFDTARRAGGSVGDAIGQGAGAADGFGMPVSDWVGVGEVAKSCCSPIQLFESSNSRAGVGQVLATLKG